MREIAPFGVRMPPELKSRLEAAAKVSRRSLNAEVVTRLWASFGVAGATPVSSGVSVGRRVAFPGVDGGHQSPAEVIAGGVEEPPPAVYGHQLTAAEVQLLEEFRKLPPGKQLALLELFR